MALKKPRNIFAGLEKSAKSKRGIFRICKSAWPKQCGHAGLLACSQKGQLKNFAVLVTVF
ncbi:hypothetical protein C1H71_17725 [Iodobacter fluviatilis]|uniref:Uncharacterized protein n=1 Tax=Iodobacter fluviatilis TaxID=537 RepID=A0A7G3GC76_9NEIS|nr:hypothetical protein C1H71_17725 [Iodobacter fluviatilis]